MAEFFKMTCKILLFQVFIALDIQGTNKMRVSKQKDLGLPLSVL